MFDEKSEIFRRYKKALVYIGVDFSRTEIIELIEDCNRDLEPKFQAIIAYWYWLQGQNQRITDPNQLLIEAFFNEWKPIGWKDEFLNNENFKTEAEKWWSQAKQVDIVKEIVVDIQEGYWSGGLVWFRHPFDGSSFSMNLDRVIDLNWQQLISAYERSTNTIIEFEQSRLIFRPRTG